MFVEPRDILLSTQRFSVKGTHGQVKTPYLVVTAKQDQKMYGKQRLHNFVQQRIKAGIRKSKSILQLSSLNTGTGR